MFVVNRIRRALPSPLRLHVGGQKRRIVDPDPELLARRDEKVLSVVEAQDRAEHPGDGEALDQLAVVVPVAVRRDADVDLADPRRIPLLNRRQAAVAGGV